MGSVHPQAHVQEKIDIILENQRIGADQFGQLNTDVAQLRKFHNEFLAVYTTLSIANKTTKKVGQRTTAEQLKRMISSEEKKILEKNFKIQLTFREMTEKFEDFVLLARDLADVRGYLHVLEEQLARRC